ncbi:uncharacterized protein EI97DRAFT_375602 [Westerdykella ornata]|uniref:RNA-dependent RNA polymerase n=1 Tax=Westerdykella ornata TaxID=318751 RepID=A0A6A6JKU6_WESOR|nr:uncharacterized protein EI97DRAFT_375602 [Westerdykella ornata]KAF2277211.1 hypothetical protein EI97DRAFT_375602 [Westerdykella ornata]
MQQPPLFKKPSLDMARSYKAPSANTSFNTSFNSNSNTVWSFHHTQGTQETAATSFNSDFGNIDHNSAKATRSSSTTLGSLEDQDLLEGIRRFEANSPREGGHFHRPSTATTRSSTTYGSIDEDALIGLPSNKPAKPTDRSVPRTPSRSKHTSSTGAPSPSKTLSSLKNLNPVTPSKSGSPLKTRTSAHKSASVERMATTNDSPSLTSWRIRNIPSFNLFVDDIDDSLEDYPYFILFISLRVALERNMSLKDLMKGLDPRVAEADQESFWAHVEGRTGITPSFRESRKIWAAAKDDFDCYSFKGTVRFNPKFKSKDREPFFNLNLSPIKKEDSCRLQRNFGADRFLYLTFPSMDTKVEVEKRWQEWFLREHSFLGRKWRAFYVKSEKKAKSTRDKKEAKSTRVEKENILRVVLFATEGLQITTPCSIADMLNWFFPFEHNQNQSICKAFARLDLALSTTVPTLVFKPSQVRNVRDIVADGLLEDTRFNDHSLHWSEIEGKPAVMNDGCSLISLGAAQEIWRLYKKRTGRNERMPTAFQARIGGAKGLWVVSPEAPRSATETLPIWIEISESQLKLQPHPEDLLDEKFDPVRLTFDVNDYSRMPTPSDLHTSFISIMVDRGVPVAAIERAMNDHLDIERTELLEMLEDNQKTYNWVHRQSNTVQNLEDMTWQAGLPASLRDKVKLLIEGGFDPREEPYLGSMLSSLIREEHLDEEKKLRIPLAKSTNMFGIADPLGVLAPGEVHVQFSGFFEILETEESFLSLENIEVLIARQPACRRSDIQKARAVAHPSLSYLVDVIVFPSRGQYPMAGKLQGGDYDGDRFWVCWEEDLVRPFKNAPAPTQALDHTRYGIQQDTTKLREIMPPDDAFLTGGGNSPWVDEFLRKACEFRLRRDMLGKVTKYHEKRAYQENRIYSETLDALCDMHDLLVDALKQGYMFSEQDFEKTKQRLKLPRELPIPTYEEAMDAAAKKEPQREDWEFKKHNAIDYLYFLVVKKHHRETHQLVEKRLSKEVADDEAVSYLYRREISKCNVAINFELSGLKRRFEPVYRHWNAAFGGGNNDLSSEEKGAAIAKCYNLYEAIKPENDDLPEIKMWTQSYLSENMTLWPFLKASALYATYPKKWNFVYRMAGEYIAMLKAYRSEFRSLRTITGPIYSMLRPRLPPNPVHEDLRGSDMEEKDEDDDSFVTPMEE